MLQIDIADPALKAEATEMIKLAERLSKCITEYLLAKQFVNKKFKSLVSSHLMAKYLQRHTWETPSVPQNDVRKYKMTVEFIAHDTFTIGVEHSKCHASDADESNSIALVVGDTDNNLILHSDDM